MNRAWMAVVTISVVAAACTATGSDRSEPSESPSTTSEPTPSTTSGGSEPPSSDEALDDPIDELSGYTIEDVGAAQSAVEQRLDALPADLFDSDQRSLVTSDDDEVVVATLAPAGQGRGDPTFADAVAAGVAGNLFAEPEFVDIEGTAARRLFVDDRPWYFWASNTRLFIVVGETEGAEAVLAELMEITEGEYLWQRGDCLRFAGSDDLPFAPFGVGELVECESPHSHEVTHSEVLEDGPDDPYPGDELEEQADATCGEAFAEYIGAPPRLTTLNPVVYRPDQSEWAEGDRYVACVVGAAADGELVGSVADGAEEYARVVAIGDCVSDAGPIDCDERHWGEIIAIPTHPGEEDDPYPGTDEVDAFADEECRDALADADTTPGELPINVQGRGPTAFDWAAGSRQFECLAFVTEDGLTPSDVIGSFTGEWRSLGEGIVV